MSISNASKSLLQTVFGSKAQSATIETYNGAVYYAVGLMKAGTSRRNENVERVYALVFDDVGTKVDRDLVELFMPVPTYIIESSPKNYQYGWAIDGGMEPLDFVRLRDGAAHRFNATEARAPSNLVRLPEGVNGKPKHPNWTVTIGIFNSGLRYPQDELFKSVGPGAPRRAPSQGPQKAPSLSALRDLLRSMPNDKGYDYDRWIAVGLAIYGATDGSEEGRASWILWSEQQPPGDFTAAEKWETFSPTSAGWGALEIMARGSAAEVFDDGVDVVEETKPVVRPLVRFTPVGGKARPVRPWVYGKRLVRGYAAVTVAAGGVGKSSLTMVEALSMATGRDLLDVGADKMPLKPQRVWIWNGEDPLVEMELRLEAACQHYGLNADDVAGRLFIESGRDAPIKLVRPVKGGMVVNEALVAETIGRLQAHRIDVMMIDPLVAAHTVSENDNMAMDLVVKTIGRIAGECGVAVEIVHHTRKTNGESNETSVDDTRGAGAVIAAARHLRVLTVMPRATGEKHGIPNYRSYFCVSRDAVKTNLTPPLDSDRWYRMASVDLDNGDPFGVDGPVESENVGVAEKWTLTVANVDRLDMISKAHGLMTGKQWRYDAQSPDWVGGPVAEALGLDITQGKAVKASVKSAIDKWIRDGWLRKVQGKVARHDVVCVEKGNDPPDAF